MKRNYKFDQANFFVGLIILVQTLIFMFCEFPKISKALEEVKNCQMLNCTNFLREIPMINVREFFERLIRQLEHALKLKEIKDDLISDRYINQLKEMYDIVIKTGEQYKIIVDNL